jgi:hypothetical protein
MHHPLIRDALENQGPGGNSGSFSWFAALAIAAMVIGSTLALVAVNEAPSDEPQVTVGH